MLKDVAFGATGGSCYLHHDKRCQLPLEGEDLEGIKSSSTSTSSTVVLLFNKSQSLYLSWNCRPSGSWKCEG